MPLMMCPNDSNPMTTVERSGVQFDMCPTCRGVWLDRGELEKLMESARQDGESAASARPGAFQQDRYREADRRPDRGYYRDDDDDDHRRYPKRRGSIFDIFD